MIGHQLYQNNGCIHHPQGGNEVEKTDTVLPECWVQQYVRQFIYLKYQCFFFVFKMWVIMLFVLVENKIK